MTYQELWQRLTPLYDDNEAKAIVRMVLDIRFGLSLTDIYSGKVTELSANDRLLLEEMMKRLEKGMPVQYVLGQAEFAGHLFNVREGVLIPRPETAELCEWIVQEHLTSPIPDLPSAKPHIIDIGTGSGCIAITLSLACPQAHVTAWDISPDALAVARLNAKALGADIAIEERDILDKTTGYDGPLANIIVSNPPYICRQEQKDMEENVLAHEPHLALFVPDDDPLLFYRAITRFAAHQLVSGGWLYFEINPLYAHETKSLLAEEGFSAIDIRQDQFSKERMIRGQFTGCRPSPQPSSENTPSTYVPTEERSH